MSMSDKNRLSVTTVPYDQPPRHNGGGSHNSSKQKTIIVSCIVLLLIGTMVFAFLKRETIKRIIGNLTATSETSTTVVEPETSTQPEADTESETFVTAHIYYDANGGSVELTEKEANVGEVYGELPNAIREGYVFLGWFTTRDGNEQIFSDTVIKNESETIYAHWNELTTTPLTKIHKEIVYLDLDLMIYQPPGFKKVDPGLNALIYSTYGQFVNDKNSDLTYYVTEQDDVQEASEQARQQASLYSVGTIVENCSSPYPKTINGVEFFCIDYYNSYLDCYSIELWHKTSKANGEAIVHISVRSSDSLDDGWRILEESISENK